MVHVGQRAEELSHNAFYICHGEFLSVLSDLLKQLSPVTKLHHDENVGDVKVVFVYFDYVYVIYFH